MRRVVGLALAFLAALALGLPVSAEPPNPQLSGAIWTTLSDGSIVNLNQYERKEDVYLNGGPGINAPSTAGGLPNGTYVFQVTDPSGKVLLSSDNARCRQVVVGTAANGAKEVFVNVAPAGGCAHLTGLDTANDRGGITVRLFPFNDSPNNGGEYKAWLTPVDDFLAGCKELGVANGLDVVDCGEQGGNRHGFINSRSKTDNFKVKGESVREIDVEFFVDSNNDSHYQAGEKQLSGLKVGWTDTLGVRNTKYSGPQFTYGIRAFIEVPEVTETSSVHQLSIVDQKGCKVGQVHVNDFDVTLDSQGRLDIDVTGNMDYLVQVACVPRR